eukprot:scpid44510/ scgid16581/ 
MSIPTFTVDASLREALTELDREFLGIEVEIAESSDDSDTGSCRWSCQNYPLPLMKTAMIGKTTFWTSHSMWMQLQHHTSAKSQRRLQNQRLLRRQLRKK